MSDDAPHGPGSEDTVRPWRTRASRTVLQTPIFDVREDRSVHPRAGHESPFVVLESPDWVNVVALTDDNQLILVRQWRHGTRTIELEIPAGLVDEGETALEAAARELREETGYSAASMTVLGTVRPNAAFQDNTCTTVLARGCRQTHQVELDENEDIEVLLADPVEVRRRLLAGELRNGMVVVGLYWWLEQSGRVYWGG